MATVLSLRCPCQRTQLNSLRVTAQSHVRFASVLATFPTKSSSKFPSTQLPSHKHPALRKSQLHRQYQSLLHSSPIILIFQHNNLKASEWAAIRNQLSESLSQSEKASDSEDARELAANIKIHIVQTAIFKSALKVVEFYNPLKSSKSSSIATQQPSQSKSSPDTIAAQINHGLSKRAWRESRKVARKQQHGLEPLMSGPLMMLSFPSASPAHVATALKILSPGDKFTAPKRKANPGYYEPDCQAGLQKLMLLGARVEGRALDRDGVKWVGGIEGGLDGLRAQLIGLLSSAGAGLAGVLEGVSKNLWLTVESRRLQLQDENEPATAPEPEKTD